MPPSPRQGCSATPSSALPSSSRRYSSRPRRSSTPAPAWCTIHRCPRGQASVCPSPWAPSCVLQSCSAPGRIDTLAGASILSQESGAPRVPARPQVIQEVDEAALTWATRRCWNLLFLRRWREQRHSFPWWRAGRRIFSFCSAAGPRASGTHFLKKEQFPFPPGSQVHGMTVCDALLPHSRPRTFLPVAKRVRFGDDIPPHAPLASPVWDPGSLVGMPQKAPPSVPSTPTPFCCTSTGMSIVLLEPLAQRLEAWLTLPSLSRWLTRTIRLGYAIQFARWPPKFNGVLETLVAVPCLARGDCCPPGKLWSLQPRGGRGFTALTSSYPRNVVAFDQSWICEFWTGLYTSSRSRCGCAGALSNASSPRIGLQRSTWRMLTFMFRSFCDADHSYGLHSRVGHGSTGSSPSGSPCLPVCSQRS